MFDDDVMRRTAGFEFDESRGNGAEDWANIEAEVAADAFVGDDGSAGIFLDFDGLMAAVVAADGAAAAADTEIVVDFGHDLEVAVEIFARNDVRKGLSDEVTKRGEAVFEHEDFEAVLHVFDDAVAVLHDGCRDLEVFSAEEQEFNSILPCFDAADTGNRHIGEFGILFELCNVTQSDRLDSGPGVTGNRGFAVDDRHTGDVFEVDVADRFDGIDAGNGIGTAFHGTTGRIFDVSNVRGHFCDDREMGVGFDDAGVFFDEFGVHADVGTHGMGSHLRAAEVEFEHVGTGFRHFASEQSPFIFICAHDGNAHDLCGIVVFETANDFGIFLPAVFGNLLHIFEADPADVFFADVVETRRAFVHAVDADSFIEDAAPAEVEAFGDHFIVVANGGRGKEERIFAVDAEEIDREINFFGHI